MVHPMYLSDTEKILTRNHAESVCVVPRRRGQEDRRARARDRGATADHNDSAMRASARIAPGNANPDIKCAASLVICGRRVSYPEWTFDEYTVGSPSKSTDTGSFRILLLAGAGLEADGQNYLLLMQLRARWGEWRLCSCSDWRALYPLAFAVRSISPTASSSTSGRSEMTLHAHRTGTR